MTIADMLARGKALLGRIPRDFVLVAILVLSATASFGLGYLTGKDTGNSGGVWIEDLLTDAERAGPAAVAASLEQSAPGPAPVTAAALPSGTGKYVASKNGTRYYLPTCGGVNRIKPENRVWFKTKEEAEAKGLTPASNCPGL